MPRPLVTAIPAFTLAEGSRRDYFAVMPLADFAWVVSAACLAASPGAVRMLMIVPGAVALPKHGHA